MTVIKSRPCQQKVAVIVRGDHKGKNRELWDTKKGQVIGEQRQEGRRGFQKAGLPALNLEILSLVGSIFRINS